MTKHLCMADIQAEAEKQFPYEKREGKAHFSELQDELMSLAHQRGFLAGALYVIRHWEKEGKE